MNKKCFLSFPWVSCGLPYSIVEVMVFDILALHISDLVRVQQVFMCMILGGLLSIYYL